MSVADNAAALVYSIIAAPFVAIFIGAMWKIINVTYQATRIEGNGQFSQAQESVHSSAQMGLNLLSVASSIETLILFLLVLLGILAWLNGDSGGR